MKRFLGVAVLSMLAGTVQAEVAGRVLMAVGDVTAIRAGRAVPLNAGSNVESGDEVRTGRESNAQIRFTDSGIVALRPETNFAIEQYRFNGNPDGSELSFFNLLKGGMRTVTGLIGRLHKRSYGIRTATSTIGIRGTHFNLVSCSNNCRNADGSLAPNGTYGGVSDGRVASTPNNNPGGEREFGAGEFFRAPDANSPAERLIGPPPFLADRLEAQNRSGQRKGNEGGGTAQAGINADGRAQQPVAPPAPLQFVATNDLNSSGTNAVLISNVTGFFAQYANSSLFDVVDSCNPSKGSCNSNEASSFTSGVGGITGYSGSGTGFPMGSLAGGTIVESGTATIGGAQYGWGRWIGPFSVVASDGSTQTGASLPTGVMFAFTNDPTVNSASGTTLPTSGVVNYVFVGGPNPVDTAGNVGSINASSVSGSVDFLARRVTFNTGIDITVPVLGTPSPASITASGSGSIPAGQNDLKSAGISGSCVGAGCATTSVSGQFDARFAGSGAPVMAVNGALIGAVKNSINQGTNSVLFLNVLKCSTC